MKRAELAKVYKQYDITLTQLKAEYVKAVREAEKMWREGAIQDCNGVKICLLAFIRYSARQTNIEHDVYWFRDGFTGLPFDWYETVNVELIINGMGACAAEAYEWLSEDKYYQKTGNISQRAMQHAAESYPLEFKSFEDVAIEIAQKLLGVYVQY